MGEESASSELVLGMLRSRRAREGAREDERWLRFIARFRFVDVRVLALRFGVSEPAVWLRVRRLSQAQLLERRTAGRTTIFFASARARRLLGLPRRKAPRTSDRDLAHELALARWVADLELALQTDGDPSTRVLTERELRRLHTAEAPYCAFLSVGGRMQQRWPDVVLERADGQLVAFEFEFTDKDSRRLAAIIAAYDAEPRFAGVTFLVCTPALAARIATMIARHGGGAAISVEPFAELDETTAEQIRHRIDAACATASA